MKKVISTILAVACFASMLLAGAERTDGSADILWSAVCIGSAVLTGLLFAILNPTFRKEGLFHHE